MCFTPCTNYPTNHHWFSYRENNLSVDKFKVQLNWTRTFMHASLNWQFRKPKQLKVNFQMIRRNKAI